MKNPVDGIGKLEYGTAELERIFNPLDLSRDQLKSWNSIKPHLFDEVVGNFGSMTNSNLESAMDNFGAANVSDGAEGSIPVQTFVLIEAKAHSSGVTNLTLSNTIVKDEGTNLVVGIGMEVMTLISVQSENIVIPTATTPSPFIAMEDLGLNVRVEVIEAMVMEEYYKQCNYEDIILIRKADDVESRFYQILLKLKFLY